jgi:hypothetical protein
MKGGKGKCAKKMKHSEEAQQEFTLLSQLWFALLNGSHNHITNTRGRQTIQAGADTLDGDDVQVLCTCIVGTVYHSANRESGSNGELGATTTSSS